MNMTTELTKAAKRAASLGWKTRFFPTESPTECHMTYKDGTTTASYPSKEELLAVEIEAFLDGWELFELSQFRPPDLPQDASNKSPE